MSKRQGLRASDISDMSLTDQAQYIVKTAEKFGIEQNFLFITTFKRYQTQINILSKLEQAMRDSGYFINKEYVKGRENLYIHPAVKEYNRTTDSVNGTLQKLLQIIRTMRGNSTDDETDDPLLAILNGDMDEMDELENAMLVAES